MEAEAVHRPWLLLSIGRWLELQRLVERTVDVMHEVRCRDHPELEGTERLLVERDTEPGRRARIEERHSPDRATPHDPGTDHVSVANRAPKQHRLLQRRLL